MRGPNLEADLPHLLDALHCFVTISDWLILDLTHVSVLSRHVTISLLRTGSDLAAQGVEIRVLTRPGSPAERMMDDVPVNQDRTLLPAVSSGTQRA